MDILRTPDDRFKNLRGGGHFIQEDCGEELSRVVLEWIHV